MLNADWQHVLYFAAALQVASSVVLVVCTSNTRGAALDRSWPWLFGATVAFGFLYGLLGFGYGGLGLFAVSCLGSAVLARWIPTLRPVGRYMIAARAGLPIATAGALVVWLREGSQSTVLAASIVFFSALALVNVLRILLFGGTSALIVRFPRLAAARTELSEDDGSFRPKVSIHVPCYNEPPAIVIGTLRALSRLRYPNFEVVVLDNNTPDPGVWKPVARECAALGERFRFFHRDGITGAKAGALNVALDLTAADAEYVAVVDADYVAEPDFLRYVALFRNPRLGFVQTSHDYRQWRGTRFLRGAYYEYVPFHKVSLPVLNEFSASFTVGTMCLYRREALEAAGRWCTTCLTEDSEIAIRIHAAGYTGHTFADTAGRGLIPETFGSMKRQQFRWTAGPVQQMLIHWRLLLGLSRDGRRLEVMQRIVELHHSTARLGASTRMVFDFVAILALTVILGLAGSVAAPSWILVMIVVSMGSGALDSVVPVRLSGARSFGDFFYSGLIRRGLDWTHLGGSLAPLFKRNLQWKSTDKRGSERVLWRALLATAAETTMGACALAMAGMLLWANPLGEVDVGLLLAIVLLVRGFGLLCAPACGLLAELDLARADPAASDTGAASKPLVPRRG